MPSSTPRALLLTVTTLVSALFVSCTSLSSNTSVDEAELQAVGVHATGCGPTINRASGLVVGPGLVLTAAHPVAGADTITVELAGLDPVPATIAAFDPWMDLAYLQADADALQPAQVTLRIADRVEPGRSGVVAVYQGEAPTLMDAAILRRVWITTEDVYLEESTRRPGFDIAADIDLGDSGGALVVDGELVGVIWARVRDPEELRAYAIDLRRAGDLINRQLETGRFGAKVDPRRCRWDPIELTE